MEMGRAAGSLGCRPRGRHVLSLGFGRVSPGETAQTGPDEGRGAVLSAGRGWGVKGRGGSLRARSTSCPGNGPHFSCGGHRGEGEPSRQPHLPRSSLDSRQRCASSLPRRSWRSRDCSCLSSCRSLREARSSRWLSDSCSWSPAAAASEDSSRRRSSCPRVGAWREPRGLARPSTTEASGAPDCPLQTGDPARGVGSRGRRLVGFVALLWWGRGTALPLWPPTCSRCRRLSMTTCTARSAGSRAAGEQARGGDAARGGLLGWPRASWPSVLPLQAGSGHPASACTTFRAQGGRGRGERVQG